jgi:hypothetical protein
VNITDILIVMKGLLMMASYISRGFRLPEVVLPAQT